MILVILSINHAAKVQNMIDFNDNGGMIYKKVLGFGLYFFIFYRV